MKLGPFRHRIKFGFHKPDNEDEGQLLGQQEQRTETIYVSLDQTVRNQQETFVHESLHAVFDVTGLAYEMKDQPEMEEELVRRLSPMLLAWLRENKGMVAWLTS